MPHSAVYLSLTLLLASTLTAKAEVRPAQIPESFHGTYSLTTPTDLPQTAVWDGERAEVVLTPGGALCIPDYYILTDPQPKPGKAEEVFWTVGDADMQLSMSDITGDFEEINALTGDGAFLGQIADYKASDSIACGARSGMRQDIDELVDVFELAEEAFPGFFPTGVPSEPLRMGDGFIYRHYPDSGAYIGISGDDVYLMGGPFGSQPHNVGAITSVVDQLYIELDRGRPPRGGEEAELTRFQVKENAATGVAGFPVTAVFPLPEGEYQDATNFAIRDHDGQPVAAQFEVLNRWWGKDNSVRHIVAHFMVDIPAHQPGQANSGVARFSLHRGASEAGPQGAVEVSTTEQSIQLSNSELAITVNRSPFSIQTPTGELSSRFFDEQGVPVDSFDRDDITVEVEESGPVRAVIRASSPAVIQQDGEVRHGWALRLYTYANSSLLKVDFQLQNSPKNHPLGAPMYFQGHELVLEDADTATALQRVRAGERLPDEIDSLPMGVVSSANATAVLRDFWQRFPSGVQADENGIVAELWPRWSRQLMDAEFSEVDLYWLDDMEHKYREVLFDFDVSSGEQHSADALARTFQYPPVAVLPQQYYADTAVTLDLGGVMPVTGHQGDDRTPQYRARDYEVDSNGRYAFGQDNFGLDLARKTSTANTGGWAYSRLRFLVSGDPADYFRAQDAATAEINIRPQWMAEYNNDRDFEALELSTNPYSGNSWRRFRGHGEPTLQRGYLDGTRRLANPRDDQHAWFYHVEHAYLMSANLWIKDWYEFMGEFKQIYLQGLDPYPDRSHRGEGQALDVALAAYRATGNARLGELLQQYLANVHKPDLRGPHNISSRQSDDTMAAFQVGYLLRAFINLYNEFPPDPELERVIQNYLEWNKDYSNFGYYTSILTRGVNSAASGSSLTLVDPQLWFGMNFGRDDLVEHALKFVEQGIGGNRPYGNWGQWRGQFESRLYHYYLQQRRSQRQSGSAPQDRESYPQASDNSPPQERGDSQPQETGSACKKGRVKCEALRRWLGTP